MTKRRLLITHAHPDDESSQSAATLARYTAEGAQVTLVTSTLGERGEILVDEWKNYSPAQLGQHRIQELAEALKILGVTDHLWLGGPGTYHDSGMITDDQGTICCPDDAPSNAFWYADLLEAANHLVEIIRDRRPQVVSTYDTFGNYGHPDHIQTHRVTMYAVALAGVASHRPDLGQPWQVQRVLWSCNDTPAWQTVIEQALTESQDEELKKFAEAWQRLLPETSDIACRIAFEPYFRQCTDALLTHRSQVRAEDQFWDFFQRMRQTPGAGEGYRFVSGVPFPAGEVATDLFAGLDI